MTIAEIEIALWPRGSEGESEVAALVQRYHQQSKDIRVRAHCLDSQNPWEDVSHTMTYQNGAEITEVGSSWVESIVATNSLRPFSPAEFRSFGGPDAFLIPPWKSRKEDAEQTVYSIPYRADVRLVYYRRDLLAQAGVDEGTAFTTPQNVLKTLESLMKRTDVKSPFVAPVTSDRYMNLSFLASWVWSAGVDFIDSTGSATFDQPEALAAIADYFRAADYIAPEFRRLTPNENELEFCRGNAAVALSGPGLFFALQQQPEFAHVKDNTGIALPPGGKACRGGTHLVVWRHCRYIEAAFDFIRFLTSAQVQAGLSGLVFQLPTRLEAFQANAYADDPNYQMIAKAINTGKSYGASRLWSIVEDRLSLVLIQMGPEYFETPNVDLDSFLSIRLKPLARRINITLDA